MKNKHTARILLASLAVTAFAGLTSSCAGMWLGTETDFSYTNPGGFGIDVGVSTPIGLPVAPPPPPGPYGPPYGPPGWGPYW